eukprot:CAMPEP_0117667774 /NCGR_PEP_ID=MMETSP0804-20121206/11162_1 /TAXON_ID=1074897 /ORGANISM="Tetraselmis astigmatica, Strain CCMP880" /LENGTH=267 /DNA_ID=CAMNT_0005475555 /DNA_START=116 /DNA_END=916 /DNA_ORIENTATION=+
MSERRRNFRKRKVVEEEDSGEEQPEDPEEGGSSLRAKLQDTKLLQQYRVRAKGRDAGSLALGLSEEVDERKTRARARGMLGDAIDLSAAFNKEELVDEHAEDPNMQKYIQQEMARRRGQEVVEDEKEMDPAFKRKEEEDNLYSVPDELKTQIKQDDGQSDLGGGWAAGIQEVPLSIAFKLKNIEETEAAKKKLLEKSAMQANIKDPHTNDNLPVTFKDISANPSRNHFVRQFGKDQWRGPAAASDNHRRAKDDEVAAKFKRDERARW